MQILTFPRSLFVLGKLSDFVRLKDSLGHKVSQANLKSDEVRLTKSDRFPRSLFDLGKHI